MDRRLIRSALARAPQLQGLKRETQRAYRRTFRIPFEPEFAILKALQPGPGEVLLDIGANRGQSIDAIRLFLPKTPILAFEPLPDLAETLSAEFAFDDSVTVVKAGLSAAAGQKTLFVPTYAGYRFDGLSSLDRAEAEGWLSQKTLIGFRPDLLKVQEQTIELARLDSFALSPAFIKIDVQGAEVDVMEGGLETLKSNLPALIVETGIDKPPARFLTTLGYEAFALERDRLVPRTTPSRNGVFVHPEAPRGLDRLISR
jgi:FkbM family methyltransferase